MMSVVHPAYHCFPNGGQGNFWPSANRLFSCDLVLATAQVSIVAIRHAEPGSRAYDIHSAGYVMAETRVLVRHW